MPPTRERTRADVVPTDQPPTHPAIPRRSWLGLSTGALYPLPTEQAPEAAAAHGFRDLEVMLQTAGEYQPAFARYLRAESDAAGTRIRSVHIWQEFHPVLSPYRRRAQEARTLFATALESAQELGAEVLVWHGPKHHEISAPAGMEAFLRTLTEMGKQTADAGLVLGIENVSWCALSTTREVAALASRFPDVAPSGAVGFVFDPFQAVEAKQNPFMLLAAMGDHVVDVHLSDHREDDPAARHLPPGEGDLPWPALLRALHGSYQGPLMLEGMVGSDLSRLETVRAVLEPILAEVASEDVDPCAGTLPAGVAEGIRLFNAREFFAAHEVIEHEWHAERRPIRRLYQGILQVGVGFLHALRGNHAGALLLLSDGIEKTSDFLPRCMGVDTARLVSDAQHALDDLRNGGPQGLANWDPASIPIVHLLTDTNPHA